MPIIVDATTGWLVIIVALGAFGMGFSVGLKAADSAFAKLSVIDKVGACVGEMLRDGADLDDVRNGLVCGFLATYRNEERLRMPVSQSHASPTEKIDASEQ